MFIEGKKVLCDKLHRIQNLRLTKNKLKHKKKYWSQILLRPIAKLNLHEQGWQKNRAKQITN